MADIKYLQELSQKLADNGKLLEAGWVGFRMYVIPQQAPAQQIDEMRIAFMAGAQHLFGSIMTMLDPEDEPTDDDMQRMNLIHKELEAFANELQNKIKDRQKERSPN